MLDERRSSFMNRPTQSSMILVLVDSSLIQTQSCQICLEVREANGSFGGGDFKRCRAGGLRANASSCVISPSASDCSGASSRTTGACQVSSGGASLSTGAVYGSVRN